ncbi:MAG: dipeptide ABC transporter ATP-binding protein [Actinomycetota bacterium]
MTEPSPEPVLSVRDLRVTFGERAPIEVVHGVDIDVAPGEVVAVVGESGSGKSVTALSVIGLLPEGARASGSVRLHGRELLGLSSRELREVRGAQVALISQDPVASLNPVFTIGFQVVEAVRAHDRAISGRAAKRRAIELLELVDIPDPERRMRQFPHELSGGQCQRIGIAMALASDPQLLIADEPTTALDVTVQAEVLDVLATLGRRDGRGILLITHDMGVVAELADRVVVMRDGELVEEGTAQTVLTTPHAAYTRQLLDAVPRIGQRGAGDAPTDDTLTLDVRDLVVAYGGRLRGMVRAVDGVNLQVRRGEILGLVGESGSGKSTIGRAVIGAAPITEGQVLVEGLDIATASRPQRRAMRRRVGVIFQNPALSLNPRYTVRQSVAEPLAKILGLRGPALAERVDDLLESVGLADRRDRYPHELSGGQRQRVAIARAVSLDPALLIADEPTSALDVSVQAQVLEIFRDLQARLEFACVFVSHDLAVVDELCDSVTVLHRGQVVEAGTREQVLVHPEADYTRRLIAAAPVPDPAVQRARRAERLAAART